MIEKLRVETIDSLRTIRFGAIELSDRERVIQDMLNMKLLNYSQELPEPLRASALQFILDLADEREGESFEFLERLPPPGWSFIWWIRNGSRTFLEDHFELALAGQLQAMLLWEIDRLLTQHLVEPNHMLLQLRTLSWIRFERRASNLASEFPGGRKIVEALIDEFYQNTLPPYPGELNSYADMLYHRAALGAVVPHLALMIHGDDPRAAGLLGEGYRFYFAALQMLGELHSFADAVREGSHTILYSALDDGGKKVWERCRGIDRPSERAAPEWRSLIEILNEQQAVSRVVNSIADALDSAAARVGAAGVGEPAGQFSDMNMPLANALM